MEIKVDVLIIGAGVVGTNIARELSKYQLKCAVVDKSSDVSCGASKANSAIVHAGYDTKPNTMMAKMNVEGNAMFEALCRELSVPFKRIGSLVLALNQSDLQTIEALYQRGCENGVTDMALLTAQESFEIEPNLNKAVVGSLLAKSAGITSPYELTIACAENAVLNGVQFYLGETVVAISKEMGLETKFKVKTSKQTIKAKLIINAAGVHSDEINNFVSKEKFTIIPKKGNYLVLSKNAGNLSRHVVFQCPSDKGKGILVTPTVYGNILVGPDALEGVEKGDTAVDVEALESVKTVSKESFPELNFKQVIKTFSGIRAESDTGDFIICEASDCKNFINVAGIKSPGLTSAPAIARHVVDLVNKRLLLEKNKNFNGYRRSPMLQFMKADEREQSLNGAQYHDIVCRCEKITRGEIEDAITRTPIPVDRDGIKRRVRAGMGPCQGNYCGKNIEKDYNLLKKL